MVIVTVLRSGSQLKVLTGSNMAKGITHRTRPDADLWYRGYIGLNQVPGYIKTQNPLLSMSYPIVRQAVEHGAIEVFKVGNSMRVTKAKADAFIKLVEEGIYFPSSNAEKACWLKPRPTESIQV